MPSERRSAAVEATRCTTSGAKPSRARYRLASREPDAAVASTRSTPRSSARWTAAASSAAPDAAAALVGRDEQVGDVQGGRQVDRADLVQLGDEQAHDVAALVVDRDEQGAAGLVAGSRPSRSAGARDRGRASPRPLKTPELVSTDPMRLHECADVSVFGRPDPDAGARHVSEPPDTECTRAQGAN